MTAALPARSPWMFHSVPEYPPLTRDAHADICIVGAGIAGLTTAYLLGRKGRKVLVIDDGPIGSGMTSRTTAHLASALDDRYYRLENLHGEEGARLAAASHAAAIEAIEAIVAQELIDCDFLRVDGYLFLPPDGDAGELEREYAAALRAGLGVAWADRAPLPGLDTGRCLRFARQGQFHPLKYLAGLARCIERDGGTIFSGTHAAEAGEGSVRTSGGLRIDCDHLVVATHTPINDRVAIHTKQAPYLSYALALRIPAGSVAPALLWDTPDPYHYVRIDREGGELLLVGGEDHKTGQAEDGERRHANLERWARERYPMAGEVAHRWVGQVMEPMDGVAFIGRNPGDERVYVASGDSGNGITHGTIAGLVITDLIHGAEVAWSKLYDPSRKSLKAARDYVRENANVAKQFAEWLKPGEVGSVDEIVPGSGAIVRHGVHLVAAYRDPDGGLHRRSAACTHLGCTVSWNGVDKSWDCRCHGSRFDTEGQVLSGPATKPLHAIEDEEPANRIPPPSDVDVRPPTTGFL